METRVDSWKTEEWGERRPVENDFGKRGILFVCRKCERGFAKDATGNRYAIDVSTFAVYRLADKVTSRWLSEACPLERRRADSEDRKSRFLNGSSRNGSASKSR